MKAFEVIHGRPFSVEVRDPGGSAFSARLAVKQEVLLLADEACGARLASETESWAVEGVATRDQDTLRHLLGRNLPRLAWIAQRQPAAGPPHSLLLQVHEFPSSFTWNEPIQIGIDEKIVESARQRFKTQLGMESVVERLTEALLMEPIWGGALWRTLLSGNPVATPTRKLAFRLYGHRYAIDVEADSDDRLRATRLVEAHRPSAGSEERPIYLVSGDVSLCDITVANKFRGIAKTELDRLVEDSNSYLELWKEYNELEFGSILRRAREFGWAAYKSVKRREDGCWRFTLDSSKVPADLDQRLAALQEEQFEAAESVPAAIQGADSREGNVKPWHRPFVGEYTRGDVSSKYIDIKPPTELEGRQPPEPGYLFVALGGDTVRIQRREKAWQRIRTCTSPMPQLGLIIEGRPTPERRGKVLGPMTKAVRDVLTNPTDRQREALDVALNTPDIAAIQGPPGTGKTSVIAALMARLSESDECLWRQGLAGNTLLTSFQHDAVENAAAATLVMGLPAIKVGGRRSGESNNDWVGVWAVKTATEARAGRASHDTGDSVHQVLKQVAAVYVAYLKAPSMSESPETLLRNVRSIASPWLPAKLAEDLLALERRLMGGSALEVDEDRALVLKAVRSIRTEEVAFLDDGPKMAYVALRRLKGIPNLVLAPEHEQHLLEAQTCEVGQQPSQELLKALSGVKEALLDRLQSQPTAGLRQRVHVDVESLLARVMDELSERAKRSAPGMDVAIEEWISTLENDPVSVEETLRPYSMVLASTCQQSVSKGMAEAKQGEDTVFRSVIVDEAARANPLDLLIPMALAEHRIVLVGDHRQLPHVLEPDVEREIERSGKDETREALRKSLFERLFVELKEREKRDGIKRTVTLDVQYRMHPILGEFISKQFYEPYGEQFRSGRPPTDFAHDVMLGGQALADKVAAWIDVPRSAGAERQGRSRSRQVEARRTAAEAAELLREHPELSIGVITFYSRQCELILEELCGLDVAERNDGGGYRIRSEWAFTRDGRERFRVGTVDAFQGKEFDVVFLSITRSNNCEVSSEVTRRRKYGFLLLENRLCVAMSRQQRLLVVVGDRAMAEGKTARESVPGLVEFLSLCGGPHGAIV